MQKINRKRKRQEERAARIAEKAEKRRQKDEAKAQRTMARVRKREQKALARRMALKLRASRKAERLVERIAYAHRPQIPDTSGSEEEDDFVSGDDELMRGTAEECDGGNGDGGLSASKPSSSSELGPLIQVQRMPRVVECVSFCWIASQQLRLNENDITLTGFEKGIVDPADPHAGRVLSLLMSRLVVDQNARLSSTGSVNEYKSSQSAAHAADAAENRKDDPDYDPGSSFVADGDRSSVTRQQRQRQSLGLPYSWWGPRLINLVNGWYDSFAAVEAALARATRSGDDQISVATAAAVSAFAKAQVAMQQRKEYGEETAVKTMGSLRSFFNDEEKRRLAHVPGTGVGSGRGGPKQKRCKECAGCLREDCGMCKHCLDMKKFGGTGNLRQACMLRKCENLTYAGADSAGGRGLARR